MKLSFLRRLSQGLFLFLFLFLFLQTESKGTDTIGYPVHLFLDFDPLIFITTFLSSHKIAAAFYFSILLIFITIFLGRVFCGWICPLGTLNNLVGSLKGFRTNPLPRRAYRIKYYILIFLLFSSIFGLQLAGIPDPISLLIRSLSLSVYPLFNYSARSLFEGIYILDVPGLTDISEKVYGFLKSTVLSLQQPLFLQGMLIGLLFYSILLLNLREKRFWCKYLCPLGALLGFMSGLSFLRRSVGEGCIECGACTAACQGNSSPDRKTEEKHSECFLCGNCDDICPQSAFTFGFFKKKKITFAPDLRRRNVVISALSGVLAVPLLRTTPLVKPSFGDPRLIRPPGALEEKEFLKACIRCGECMKVCVTNGLQPVLLEAGPEGIWTPKLVPRIGYCENRCTLCGQVCPTGAIKKLDMTVKQKVKIGLAMIDQGRCLPHAQGIPCVVCQEACPTTAKAIWLEDARVKNRYGQKMLVKQPRVDLNLCIGCGICEALCPIVGKPAIYIVNTGESRSNERQVLL